MIKIPKIRKRRKKEKTIIFTALPEENDIDLSELIGYCRKNMIPLENLPEDLVNKFRKDKMSSH